MSRGTRSIDLPANPAEVWAVLAEYGDVARWAPNADESRLLSEQHEGVGAIREVVAGKYTLIERVIAWEPEAILGYDIEGLPSMIRHATNSWIVRPNGTGSSVTLLTEVDAGRGLVGRFVAWLSVRSLDRAAKKMLGGLAAAAGRTM